MGDRDAKQVAAAARSRLEAFQRRAKTDVPGVLSIAKQHGFKGQGVYIKQHFENYNLHGAVSAKPRKRDFPGRRYTGGQQVWGKKDTLGALVNGSVIATLKGISQQILDKALEHDGYGRKVDEEAGRRLLDDKGQRLCSAPNIRQLLSVFGVLHQCPEEEKMTFLGFTKSVYMDATQAPKNFRIPLDINMSQLGHALADFHTGGAIYELAKHMEPEFAAAIDARASATGATQKGILVDATPRRRIQTKLEAEHTELKGYFDTELPSLLPQKKRKRA